MISENRWKDQSFDELKLPCNYRNEFYFCGLVWFLFYGPSTHFRSFRAQSVNLATLFLGKPLRQFTSTLCTFFSPVTDNCCSSWISGRGRMAVEMFSWPSLHERMCRTWGSNSGPLACQANSLPIELPRPVLFLWMNQRFWMVRQSLNIIELTLSLKWCEYSQQYCKFSRNKIYRSLNYFNQSRCRK